jgi:hypothetical protein
MAQTGQKRYKSESADLETLVYIAGGFNSIIDREINYWAS